MGVLAEVFENHPVNDKLITPIDFVSIKDLPESHAWLENPSNDPITPTINKENVETSLPIIDLNDPNVIQHIFDACKTYGALQVINHGIPEQLFEEAESQARRLFDLPLEQKVKVLRATGGATGYGSPRIAPFFDKLMWHEGFTVMGNSSVDHAKLLWPNDYQEFCDVMDKYQAGMKELATKLAGLMLKSLSVPETEWSRFTEDKGNLAIALQLNSYPTCPDSARTMGLAPHTDSMFITILHQCSKTNGLQMYQDGSGWTWINPVPGALIVNVGDFLHIMSNGRFPSLLHRAVVNNEKQRISLAYFFGPSLDFQLTPYVNYPGCEGPCYKSMTVQEYVGIKHRLFSTALSSIRI